MHITQIINAKARSKDRKGQSINRLHQISGTQLTHPKPNHKPKTVNPIINYKLKKSHPIPNYKPSCYKTNAHHTIK